MSRWTIILTAGALTALAACTIRPEPPQSRASVQDSASARSRVETERANDQRHDAQRNLDAGIGIDQKLRKREDELREGTKSLRVGMAAEAVLAILGKPTDGVDPKEITLPPKNRIKPDPSSIFIDGPGKCFWYYSPHPTGKRHHSYGGGDDFQVLSLFFGVDDRLKSWYWITPATF